MHISQIRRIWLMVLALGVFLAGCGREQVTPTPSLTSIVPSSGTQATSVNVTITGANFAPGSTISLSATGITVSNTSVVSSTQITATFAMASTAPVGPQNVTVTPQGRASGPLTFTVVAAPTLTSIAPPNGTVGQNVPVTLTGTGFVSPAVINISGTGVTVVAGTTTVVSPTRITATFAISPTASTTARSVTVTVRTPGASTGSVTFTVNPLLPTVIATNPVNGASNVPVNNKITATFNKPMLATTINATTFLVTQLTPVAGPIAAITITYDPINNIAIFQPAANLPLGTFSATITPGATDTTGAPLVLGPPGAPNPWTFSTVAADNTQPVVVSTNPANGATGVALNQVITATFSKPMNPTTINTTNFTLFQGATPILGTVSYLGTTASFTPNNPLSQNLLYRAQIAGGPTGVQDLAGNQLGGGGAANPWTFTTGPPFTAPANRLGSASTFGAFGGSAGITNQGILTVINGNIGTTAASNLITRFHDTTLPGTPAPCRYTETPLHVGTVNGVIYTSPPPPNGTACTNEGTAATQLIAQTALADATTAYNGLTPASIPGGTDPGAGQLGGLVLAPGVYQAAGGTFLITGSDLTLDAQGDPNAVWVFQMATSLTVGAPAAPRSVILVNGAQAKNVYWQVGSAATINAAGGGTMVGTIIAQAGITFSTAGNAAIATLNGRALGLVASVTMVNTVINVPAP